jgi:hypothetical protein
MVMDYEKKVLDSSYQRPFWSNTGRKSNMTCALRVPGEVLRPMGTNVLWRRRVLHPNCTVVRTIEVELWLEGSVKMGRT